MRNDPIDYDSPLGISKREWVKVLGANLALLLLAYCVALVVTLSGSDFFISASTNERLAEIEQMLRSVHLFAIVQILFSAVEETIVLCYVMKSKPKWWWPVAYILIAVAADLTLTHTIGYFPSFMPLVIGISFVLTIVAIDCLMTKRKPLKMLARLAIAIVVTAALNALISFFRTKALEIGHAFPNTQFFYLSVEYDIALSLSLGFLTMVIPWEKGGQKWTITAADAGGSSRTTMKWSRKNSQTKNNIPEKTKRKLRLLKAKVIVIQTAALALIVALPIAVGKGTEFALLYVSFCITRVIFGFRHSLHFKSEFACTTVGALVFWGLTYLVPSVEVSIVLSLIYGAALAGPSSRSPTTPGAKATASTDTTSTT